MTGTWWRRRLAVGGRGRRRIKASLLGRLHGAGTPGLSGPEADPGLPVSDLRNLAESFVGRGDAERQAQIASWGVDVYRLTAVDTAADSEPATAAARFNLAVALFDSMVDDDSPGLSTVAGALHPDRLTALLDHPESSRLESVPGGGGKVVALFDWAIRAAGRRWRSQPCHRKRLAGWLSAMYRSELGLSSEPFDAKVLPVVFLGALGTDDPLDLALHRRLGRFVAAWDDWLDQDEDLSARRPNVFYGNPRGWGVFPYYGRALLRTIRARDTERTTCDELAARLDAVLAASRGVGEPTHQRTRRFLWRLVA